MFHWSKAHSNEQGVARISKHCTNKKGLKLASKSA